MAGGDLSLPALRRYFRKLGGFYASLTILPAGAHTDLTRGVFAHARACDQHRGLLSKMSAIQIPQHSFPDSRPVFRVVCAWCKQSIDGVPPPAGLTGDTHGICQPCARQHFGIELRPVAPGRR